MDACIGTERTLYRARADPAITIGSGWNHGSWIVQLIDSLIVDQYAWTSTRRPALTARAS
jgi:hypothetical protein